MDEMHELLHVDVVHHDGVATVRLAGELDLGSGPVAALALHRLLEDAAIGSIVVDLGELSYCDASGLNIFVNAQRRALFNGKAITLANPTPTIAFLFEIVDFADIVPVDLGSGGTDNGPTRSGGSDVSEPG